MLLAARLSTQASGGPSAATPRAAPSRSLPLRRLLTRSRIARARSSVDPRIRRADELGAEATPPGSAAKSSVSFAPRVRDRNFRLSCEEAQWPLAPREARTGLDVDASRAQDLAADRAARLDLGDLPNERWRGVRAAGAAPSPAECSVSRQPGMAGISS